MSATLTKWTPLRRMVDERGIEPVLEELIAVAKELETHAQTKDEDYRWTQVGAALRIAREYVERVF